MPDDEEEEELEDEEEEEEPVAGAAGRAMRLRRALIFARVMPGSLSSAVARSVLARGVRRVAMAKAI